MYKRSTLRRVARLWQRNATTPEIAVALGMSVDAAKAAVMDARKLWGEDEVPYRMRRWTSEERERVLSLVRDGRSDAEIGEILDRAPKSISAQLVRMRRVGVEVPARAQSREIDEDRRIRLSRAMRDERRSQPSRILKNLPPKDV